MNNKELYRSIAFLVLIGLAIFLLLKFRTPPTKGETINGQPFKGSKTAKVTIEEFCEFECGFCAKFHNEVFPQLEKDYINTGKVLFIFRNYPLIPKKGNSMIAAQAAECALEQGKFWEYHDKLFENRKALELDDLKKYARELRLDTLTFKKCLDNNETKAAVEQDIQEGKKRGINGTPTFYINGKESAGVSSYENFKEQIEKQL